MLAKIALCASLSALAASATPIGPNLIANGSFETGPVGAYAELGGGSHAIAGWTTTQSGVEYFQPSAFSIGSAHDGLAVVDLANYVYSAGGIAQTFATSAGQAYSLSFWGSTTTGSGRDGTGIILVYLNGGLAGSFDLSNPTGIAVWQNFGLDFTASGDATTLEFRNSQDANLHFANLDDVVVGLARPDEPAAVPEPSTALLLAPGLALLAAFRRRNV